MVGGYFEHFERPFFNAPDLFHTFNRNAGNYTTTNLLSNTRGEYYSAFAQARWNILPNLELAGGARWSHDQKRFRMMNLLNSQAFPTLYPSSVPLTSRYKDNNISPEVTLSWHPEPD